MSFLISRSVFLHLRLPFSLLLLPVYLFALSSASTLNNSHALVVFIVLHLLVYPACNAYNSYFDKDEGSIGGLKNPPKVDIKLWQAANIFDIIGLSISYLLIDYRFFLFVLFYILVSRMYSFKGTRIKKFAILSWLIVGIFQKRD